MLYLTLTRVVFEFYCDNRIIIYVKFNFNKSCIWITLILVIGGVNLRFNFNKSCIWIRFRIRIVHICLLFNFNKSCIWIYVILPLYLVYKNLTLTRVVFEFADGKSCTEVFRNLTLTRVVFELNNCRTTGEIFNYLTLTRVVFEYLF